jgi:regulator of sirC expression with transglutaminase-like and TPR domain
MHEELTRAFVEAADSRDDDALARAALVMARLEHRQLDPDAYLARLDLLGAEAGQRLVRLRAASARARVEALNRFLYEDLGFTGNERHYDDPRNSFLNDVIDRRTGIPITLAVVYIEVARRAGLHVEGVNFPGHFLMRCPSSRQPGPDTDDLLMDPFRGGSLMSEADCRRLLQMSLGDEAVFDRQLLVTAPKRQILIRMLVNLKHVYVKLRSFPQARLASDLLLALDPSALTELRDRGLLAYHMRDFSNALRDLEGYLELTSKTAPKDSSSREEHEQIWEHVKNLRRRVASFN